MGSEYVLVIGLCATVLAFLTGFSEKIRYSAFRERNCFAKALSTVWPQSFSVVSANKLKRISSGSEMILFHAFSKVFLITFFFCWLSKIDLAFSIALPDEILSLERKSMNLLATSSGS